LQRSVVAENVNIFLIDILVCNEGKERKEGRKKILPFVVFFSHHFTYFLSTFPLMQWRLVSTQNVLYINHNRFSKCLSPPEHTLHGDVGLSP
jgi:hypothetical protein